jgi:tetratricopeptide (TPR) repeat protein
MVPSRPTCQQVNTNHLTAELGDCALDGTPRWRRATTFWLTVALLGLTAVIYAPVRHYGFVNMDDPAYVTGNPRVTAGLSVAGVIWAFSALHGPAWHPLTALSHMLDCQLYGLNAGGHHLTSVFFHLANTLLLLMVLTHMTGQFWRSAFVAAVFALHPCQVEAVAWVSERKGLLSTFFFLLTLSSYFRFTQRPSLRRYALVLLAFACGLMAKPILMTLPFVLLLLDLWPLRRLTLGTAHSVTTAAGANARRPSVAGLVLEKVPLLVLAGISGAVTVATEGRTGGDYPIAVRIANVLVSYAAYMAHIVWPYHLAALYPRAPLPPWQVASSALILIGLSAYVVRNARRAPYLLIGWLWFLITLAPVIGVVAPARYSMADRFTYVPLIGLAIMAAWGIPDLLGRWRQRRAACSVLAVVTIAACAVVTSRQLEFWRDTKTFLQHSLDVTSDNAEAHFFLGWTLQEEGRLDEAFVHLSEALRLQPTMAQANYQMGRLLAKRGDLEAAKQHYFTALQAYSPYAEAHVALASVLAAEGDLDGALVHYREAIQLDPSVAAAHNDLAIALERTGQKDEAILQYAEAARLQPRRAESRCNLAAALARANRLPEAIEQFRIALQLKPQLVEAHAGLASAYAQTGHVRDAIAELDALLSTQPDSAAAEVTLAWLLATVDDASLRNGRRALELATDADRRTDHDNPEALNALAAAYAESGRFTDAVETAERATAVARRNGDTALLNALPARLAQYRAGLPVRQRPGGHHE